MIPLAKTKCVGLRAGHHLRAFPLAVAFSFERNNTAASADRCGDVAGKRRGLWTQPDYVMFRLSKAEPLAASHSLRVHPFNEYVLF